MRILFNDLVLFRPKSGIGTYAEELLRHLDKFSEGIEIKLLSQTLMGKPIRTFSELYSRQSKQEQVPSFSRQLFLPAIRSAGHSALDKLFQISSHFQQFDLYHEPDAIPLTMNACTIVTVHDLTVSLFPQWHPEHRVRKFEKNVKGLLSRTSHFISDSENTKQDLIRLWNVQPKKISVIPIAPKTHFKKMSQEEISLSKRQLNLPDSYILYAGTIEPRKNVAGLMRAWSKLPKNIRNSHPLLLAGGWGWRSQEVKELLEQPPWHGSTRCLGYLSDNEMMAVMNGAACLAYPSFYEGFGLPPIEAMICEVPVMCSHAGSLKEVVGNAAAIVEPHDEAKMTQVLEKITQDQSYRSELITLGIKRAKSFDWKETARLTAETYRNVLKT